MNIRKIVLILVAINVLLLTISPANTQASIVTKPLTITAKKVAKELAEDSAISMANKIVSDLIMTELTSGANNKVDIGFTAVCMDGAKPMKDCPVEKRAQVKMNLSSSDKRNLSKTVENILEAKTLTSSKWGKFLDFFIPIFLLSGLVLTFKAMLDDDSESLMDEIALESLIDLALLKPLGFDAREQAVEVYDFTPYIESINVIEKDYTLSKTTFLEIKMKANAPALEFSINRTNGQKVNYFSNRNFSLENRFGYNARNGIKDTKKRIGVLTSDYLTVVTPSATENVGLKGDVYVGGFEHDTTQSAWDEAISYWTSSIHNPVANGNTVNAVMSAFIENVNLSTGTNLTFKGVQPITEQQPIYTPEYGTPKGLQGIKNPDGTNTLPGVDSFTYVYNNTYVYPSPDSDTGWKDSVTGDDITLVPEEVVVNGGDIESPIKEEPYETEFSCKRDMELPSLKPIGNAFTNAFPFSIPWDLKRAIDNAFGGVGDTKPTFNLTFLGDGVVLTMPQMIDNWMPFLRTSLIVLFDISVLYMFYRFMKGGGD